MTTTDTAARGARPNDHSAPIQRLVFVADAAVAGVEELPPAVRAVIDEAAAVYVVTPTLPGRLAWLADEVDRCRHVADERLDAVLGHMRSIGVRASGAPARGSVLTVIADAVAEVDPDQILVALRSAEHANWQERGLIEHIEKRFGLPVMTYAVDLEGHSSSAHGPLVLCYDGSEDASHAIDYAGQLFDGKRALVVTVWRPAVGLGGLGVAGETAGMVDFFELDQVTAEHAGRVAEEGVRIAESAGLKADALVVKADGSVWKAILQTADQHDAASIVMGSRGLTGLRSMLLGSVSNGVVHHAERPALVIPRPAHA